MKRLTTKYNGGYLINMPPKNNENDLTAHMEYLGKVSAKLGEYEDLEEQEMLIRLPCKVGDTVYFPNKTWKRVFEKSVISISFDGKTTWTRCGDGICYLFGEEVFKTKEEAEQALAKMKEV